MVSDYLVGSEKMQLWGIFGGLLGIAGKKGFTGFYYFRCLLRRMKDYNTYSDKWLFSLLKTGDGQAFTEIYNRYWEKLLFIAGIKLRNLSIAEELVQDIFLDIWNRRSEIEITGELEAYLAVSMKYKVINAQAKLKRALEYEHAARRQLTAVDYSTEQWLAFEELKERLSKLVSKLPEKCRITFQLSKEQGVSHKEIAKKLGITEKAVESNLSRAVHSLRNSLGNLFSSLFSMLF